MWNFRANAKNVTFLRLAIFLRMGIGHVLAALYPRACERAHRPEAGVRASHRVYVPVRGGHAVQPLLEFEFDNGLAARLGAHLPALEV